MLLALASGFAHDFYDETVPCQAVDDDCSPPDPDQQFFDDSPVMPDPDPYQDIDPWIACTPWRDPCEAPGGIGAV